MKTSHSLPRISLLPMIASLTVVIMALVSATMLARHVGAKPSRLEEVSFSKPLAGNDPTRLDSVSANTVSAQAVTSSPTQWIVDSEQRVAATEEFQAIDDRTTELQPEEMPAYWRVMSWVDQQPIEQLRRLPSGTKVFNQFLQQPDSLRGQLVKLDLQVCRVLSYAVPENRLGMQHLYEIWGWTPESKAWLYVLVTPELPPGFPTGSEISERAICYGYFFKIQGYLEGGAAPRARPLPAPLLLGRLDWDHRLKSHATGNARSEMTWIIVIGVIAGALLAGRIVFMATQKRRRSKAADRRCDGVITAEQWLSGVQRAGSASASPLHPESSELDRRF